VDAEPFQAELAEKMRKFKLELHPDTFERSPAASIRCGNQRESDLTIVGVPIAASSLTIPQSTDRYYLVRSTDSVARLSELSKEIESFTSW